LYVVTWKDTIVVQVCHVGIGEKEKKTNPICCFPHVSKGKPMINYENMNNMFLFFKVKNFPRMH
jgi:hypothetical protein